MMRKDKPIMLREWKYAVSALGYKPMFFHNWKQARRTARQLLADDVALDVVAVMTRVRLDVPAVFYRSAKTGEIVCDKSR